MIGMRKFRAAAVIGAAILMLAAGQVAGAQGGPGGSGGPPRPGMRGMGAGPMGADDALGFLGFEAGLAGKTVTGAPFSADFSTETTQVLPDGNRIDNKTTGSFARDGQGRTRRELTISSIGGYPADNGRGPVRGIVINDPVAGVSYVLNENRKEARQSSIRRNPFGGAMRGPGANGQPQQNQSDATTQLLGTQMIGGIAAEGTRTIRTIPAGAVGNEKPIELTIERWYSSELQTNVLIKRNDPRGGTTVFQLTNIVRSEPDASLFQVPSDYSIVSGPVLRPHRGAIQRQMTPTPQ